MINVYANYYRDTNEDRRKEIDKCFQINSALSQINLVILESSNRLSFDDYFRMSDKISGDSDINIICNSDIYFDASIENTLKMAADEVYALSRWDVQVDGSIRLFDRKDSQDTFIWHGKVKTNLRAPFLLGMPGCDNRICQVFAENGYRVSNPSRNMIKTYHLHLTNLRRYDRSNVVPGPYLSVEPI